MAESTKNLGSLENTLDQLVSEVSGLRSELADLKRINTSVLNKHLVRKGSEREQHYIFFDKVSQQYDLNDSISWPACNGSAHPASNGVFENITNVIGHYQNVDWPFKVCDISTFAPPSRHKETNNLYFLEPQFIFTEAWSDCLATLSPDVVGYLQNRQMALVLWFPHEGMNFYTGFNAVGWMHQFHLQMKEQNLENCIAYFVFGDLECQRNYDEWFKHQGAGRTDFRFERVISYDYFHREYWTEYAERTGIFINRTHNIDYMSAEAYGNSELIGAFNDSVCIPYEHFDPQLLIQSPNPSIQKSYEGCQTDEVLVGVPHGHEKTKDLVCLNARPRSHRPALVSELHRLGYNNDNSYVSYLNRTDISPTLDTSEHPVENPWKEMMYNGSDITQFTARNNGSFVCFLSHDVQIEYVYKFWLNRDTVIADASTAQVTQDDRLMTTSMYKDSFFSLVSETLFSDDPHSLFITEKTYKCIAYRHPFMVVGSVGTLRYLRHLGYETFPEMFDESYDNERDLKKRFAIIVSNLEQWHQLTHEEKVEKYNSVRPKLLRNFQLFKNSIGKFERDTVNVLGQLSSHGVEIH